MKNHYLQRMIVSPRESSADPRIAKTLITERNIGADGKLYTNIDQRDYGKYRVLSENELKYELRQSMEIKAAMMSTGRLSDSRSKRPKSASGPATFSAPMFGTAGKTKKIENRAWDAEATDVHDNGNTSALHGETKFSSTISKLRANSPGSDSLQNTKGRRDGPENDGTRVRPSTAGYSSTSSNAPSSAPSGMSPGIAPGMHSGVNSGVNSGAVKGGDSGRERRESGERSGWESGRESVRNSGERSQSPAPRSRIIDENTNYNENTARIETPNQYQKSPLTSVMNALKSKYEQNLDVIEKLFDEKKSMEKLVQSLDFQLLTARKELSTPRYTVDGVLMSSSVTYDVDGDVDRVERGESFQRGNERGDQRGEGRDQYREGGQYQGGSREGSKRGSNGPQRGIEGDFLPHRDDRGDMDMDFEGRKLDRRERNEEREERGNRNRNNLHNPHNLDTSSSFYSNPHISTSPMRGVRSSSASITSNRGRKRESDREYDQMDSARRSVSRSYSADGPLISAHLQADQDRYVQRRRAMEDKEKEEKVEQQRFEDGLKDRYLRASKSGGAFTEMIKRDAIARKSFEAKTEEKKSKEKLKEKEEIALQNRLKKEQLERFKPKEDLSWADMKEQQERLRVERVAKRVQELANLTSSPGFEPSKGSEGHARQSAQRRMTPTPEKQKPVDDPSIVTARLEKQRRDWDQRLERMKDKARTQREERTASQAMKGPQAGTTMALGDKLFHGTAKMVQRAVEAEEKRMNKSVELKKKESDIKNKKMEEERRQREKLLNCKVPEEGRRLTKAAENRANVVRQSREAEENERLKEEALMVKKRKSEKQHGEIIRTILDERERDRKENYQGEFVELNKSQVVTDAIAAENRERFRSRLRVNKKKIELAKEARPSLLLRHDQSVAKTMAGSSALNKVAQAVLGDKLNATTGQRRTGGKSAIQAMLSKDDFFDDNQKILLGYQDNFDTDEN